MRLRSTFFPLLCFGADLIRRWVTLFSLIFLVITRETGGSVSCTMKRVREFVGGEDLNQRDGRVRQETKNILKEEREERRRQEQV